MLANESLFELSSVLQPEKAAVAWQKAQKENKTELALKYALEATQWNVPRYIADGLRWLAEAPSVSQPVLTPVVATTVPQSASLALSEVTNA
jgi:hypothetical protein